MSKSTQTVERWSPAELSGKYRAEGRPDGLHPRPTKYDVPILAKHARTMVENYSCTPHLFPEMIAAWTAIAEQCEGYLAGEQLTLPVAV